MHKAVKKIFSKIKKYITYYGHFPRVSPYSYIKILPTISLLLIYLERKYLKNKSLLKFYPLRDKGTYFEHPLYIDGEGFAYYSQYYKLKNKSTIFLGVSEMAFYKSEIIKGKKNKANHLIDVKFDQRSVLPISIINNITKRIPSFNTQSEKKYKLDVSINNKRKYSFGFEQNRYNYLSFKKGDSVQIKSNTECIVGSPIQLSQSIKTDRKLVLLLFCDNLSSRVLEKKSLSRLMPNTHRFFSKGKIFNNHHINGHWTLDSVPTFFTGKLPSNHGIYDPFKQQNVAQNNFTISNAYHENGYLTFHIGGNQRVAPNYGYCQEFDRTVFGRHQPCEETVAEAIDQIKSFPERSQFGFLSFMDLHNTMEHSPSIISQINASYESRNYTRKKTRTVSGTTLTQLDSHFDELYEYDIQRLDFYLSQLYSFIEEEYNDEMLVALVSDHGYHSLKDNTVLSSGKTSVPFMIRGSGIESGEVKELTENIDIFPSMLYHSKIEIKESIDGILPKSLGGGVSKKYAFSEAIYPNQPYRAKIIDDRYIFQFINKNKSDNNGKITDIGQYTCSLIDRKSRISASKEKENIVTQYAKIVTDHIFDSGIANSNLSH